MTKSILVVSFLSVVLRFRYTPRNNGSRIRQPATHHNTISFANGRAAASKERAIVGVIRRQRGEHPAAAAADRVACRLGCRIQEG